MTGQISRELMGKIVDEVFDGSIEDASVIEDIYRVIVRESALTLTGTVGVKTVNPLDFRCPECNCRSFADVQDAKCEPTGAIRCVGCKQIYHTHASVLTPMEPVGYVLQATLEELAEDPSRMGIISARPIEHADSPSIAVYASQPSVGGRIEELLEKIKELRFSETGDPLDDACDIAEKALALLQGGSK